MKYSVDKWGNVTNIKRNQDSYVDVLTMIIDMNNFEFMQFLEGFCSNAESMGASSREIKASLDMMARERSIIRKDLGL